MLKGSQESTVVKEFYRRCSTCKAGIPWGAELFTCSVSTCNQKRTGLYFCSLPCWDAHLPTARHRDAWAEKQIAPTTETDDSDAATNLPEARRRVVATRPSAPQTVTAHPALSGTPGTDDVLVVVSKLKAYIKDRSGMNTSAGVVELLSDHLRELCDRAIIEAASQERKTVLDRDLEAVLRRVESSDP